MITTLETDEGITAPLVPRCQSRVAGVCAHATGGVAVLGVAFLVALAGEAGGKEPRPSAMRGGMV